MQLSWSDVEAACASKCKYAAKNKKAIKAFCAEKASNMVKKMDDTRYYIHSDVIYSIVLSSVIFMLLLNIIYIYVYIDIYTGKNFQ